ncbi:MAG TPA: 5-formyltetrahydrofolate cyclo-ligase [Steroidobacteraceae bacterium]|nr:5-formyltetrahydrofolate cyclo-ligase [Steroidobacteraceae bacterium]
MRHDGEKSAVMKGKDETREYSSPACLLHEFETTPPSPSERWEDVKLWRKARREELLARRAQRSAEERLSLSAPILEYLFENIDASKCPVLGLYWPIRGEIDLRALARRHVESGGIVGLPVVVQKAAPVEFWRWHPGVAMRRGLWDIPVPPERAPVTPQLLVIPLVGFDGARFRLGYGGGFYDRTLAAAAPRPKTIGIGFADAQLPTIYPQPHDVPMELVVTDRFTLPA